MKSVRLYLWNVVAGLSHFVNALSGGTPRVSLSARLGAEAYHGNRLAKVLAFMIDAILFSRNHCLEHAAEEGLI